MIFVPVGEQQKHNLCGDVPRVYVLPYNSLACCIREIYPVGDLKNGNSSVLVDEFVKFLHILICDLRKSDQNAKNLQLKKCLTFENEGIEFSSKFRDPLTQLHTVISQKS